MDTAPPADAAPPRRCCAALCVTRRRPRGLGRRISRFFGIRRTGPGYRWAERRNVGGRMPRICDRRPLGMVRRARGARPGSAPPARRLEPTPWRPRWATRPRMGFDGARRAAVQMWQHVPWYDSRAQRRATNANGSWGHGVPMSAARGCAFAVRGCARHAARVTPQQNRRDPAFLLKLH